MADDPDKKSLVHDLNFHTDLPGIDEIRVKLYQEDQGDCFYCWGDFICKEMQGKSLIHLTQEHLVDLKAALSQLSFGRKSK